MNPMPARPSRRPSEISRPSESPRANALRELGVSNAVVRAAEKFDEASSAFDAACEERHGVGDLDERYGDLVHHAGEVLVAVVDDRLRAALGEDVVAAIAPYERGDRRVGDAPEEDVRTAERVCRAVLANTGKGARASS
jgi:hypothetical protein